MREKDADTREKIIKYTLELVQKEEDFSKITVRRIVSEAGVSLSAVNYHFGSKEKLINEVIRIPIMRHLASQPDPYRIYGNDPVRMLKELVKIPAAYLAANPNISRISILTDMSGPMENDLTMQTMEYWRPAVRQIFGDKDGEGVGLILWELISAVQAAFLRDRCFTKTTGFDYYNEAERDSFIGKLVDSLVDKYGGVNDGTK